MSIKVLEHKGGFRIEGYGGGKGGGSQRTPVESPDDLHSISRARILDLVSNGEIEGPAHGLEAGLRDIYLDGTPLANSDGALNFPDVTIDFRSGTQNQDYIKGFPSSEATAGVGIELRSDASWVRSITNKELSAVRVTLAVQGLSKVNTENGDINGYRIDYVIEVSIDGGAYQIVVDTAFRGKTTSTYARTHRIDLPDSTTGWNIRVRRTTPNADSTTIADRTFIIDFTEVIDAKLRYPMSALVGIQIDAQQFQSIPVRAYHLKGRRIKIPSNYDPVARTYTGTWDGTFQTAYSNNPAWVFYDIVTNDLYGLGDVIPSAWIDKWSLYPIGQYCDEMVPDGNGTGGLEPRFTCNVYIQSRANAWKVLQDISSVFRGITYYAGGSVFSTADAPRDPVYTYSSANVVGGRFNYTGSSRTARFTVALVSWNDMTDLGRSKVEVVEDRSGIVRYGLRPKEITAFGCTSQGQAQRLGRWLLLTSQLETQGVTFQVGLDGAIAMPGQIIQIADPARAGRRIGGRVVSSGVDFITVDSPVVAGPGDEITITLPSGITETRTISAAVGGALTADITDITADMTELWVDTTQSTDTNAYTADTTGLTADAGADTTYLTADMAGYMSNIVNIFVTQNFSEVPAPETMWALNTEELTTQRFCVTGVTEKDGIVFEISAVQHIAGKFEAIDYATKIVIPPTTIIPPVSQAAPETVTISAFSVLVQGRTAYSAAIECSSVQGAVAYEFEWRRDDSDWISAGKTGSTRKEIPNILSGSYLARVRAINSLGVSSLWTVSMLTELDGLIAPPPQVSSLTTSSIVFGIKINWSFPASLNIIERTEIYYSTTNNFANAIKLGDFAYPQNTHTMMGLSAGMSLYFWAKLIDKNGLPGERYPSGTTGVLGQASANAGEILGYLTEQITSTQLSAALMTEIDKIAINETAIQATETAIQTETTARVNGDNALASQINTVSAVADGNVAAIQTETTARVGIENDLAAMYTIKTQLTSDGRTYVAGIGVGVENNQGIIESQVLVKADRFAVINPTGTGVVVPFVVQGNQVFISSAFINELSAEVLKATWAQVDELIAGKLRSADSRMVIDLNNVTFTMLKGVP